LTIGKLANKNVDI